MFNVLKFSFISHFRHLPLCFTFCWVSRQMRWPLPSIILWLQLPQKRFTLMPCSLRTLIILVFSSIAVFVFCFRYRFPSSAEWHLLLKSKGKVRTIKAVNKGFFRLILWSHEAHEEPPEHPHEAHEARTQKKHQIALLLDAFLVIHFSPFSSQRPSLFHPW